MKLIDWLIKKLVNYKYKKDPFLAWSWSIGPNLDMNIISEESYVGYHRFGTKIDTIDTDEEEDEDEDEDEREKTYIVNLYDLKKAIVENPYDPEKNIAGYLRYLRYNTPEFKKEAKK